MFCRAIRNEKLKARSVNWGPLLVVIVGPGGEEGVEKVTDYLDDDRTGCISGHWSTAHRPPGGIVEAGGRHNAPQSLTSGRRMGRNRGGWRMRQLEVKYWEDPRAIMHNKGGSTHHANLSVTVAIQVFHISLE